MQYSCIKIQQTILKTRAHNSPDKTQSIFMCQHQRYHILILRFLCHILCMFSVLTDQTEVVIERLLQCYHRVVRVIESQLVQFYTFSSICCLLSVFEILYRCLLSPLTLAKLASPSLQSAISGVLVCVFVPINPDSRF